MFCWIRLAYDDGRTRVSFWVYWWLDKTVAWTLRKEVNTFYGYCCSLLVVIVSSIIHNAVLFVVRVNCTGAKKINFKPDPVMDHYYKKVCRCVATRSMNCYALILSLLSSDVFILSEVWDKWRIVMIKLVLNIICCGEKNRFSICCSACRYRQRVWWAFSFRFGSYLGE